MKKILNFILVICLILPFTTFLFACNKKSTATSVMTMSVNPEVQFVLDQNNKVMYANAINQDGENLIASVDFKGLTAEQASDKFLEISTKLGKINVESTGTKVEITITCEDETNAKIKDLANKVKNRVNKFFNDSLIIGGAVIEYSKDLATCINNLAVEAVDSADKSFNDLMVVLEEKSDEIKNITLEARSALQTQLDTATKLIDATIETLERSIAEYEKLIADYEEQLKKLPEEAKKSIQSLLNTAKSNLKTAKQQLKEKKEELKTIIKEVVETVENQCKKTLTDIKTSAKNLVESNKQIITEHLNKIDETTKSQIQQQIEAFQASLTK